MWRSIFLTQRSGIVHDDAAFVRQLRPRHGETNCPTSGLCLDLNNHIVVSLASKDLIQVLGRHGSVVQHFGGARVLNHPHSVCVTSAGHIIVVDNRRVMMFSSEGTFMQSFGSQGRGDGQFATPWRACVGHNDQVVVVDSSNNCVQVFASDGTFLLKFGTCGMTAGRFYYPQGVCVDLGGNIIVADTGNNRIQQFLPDGTFVRAFGSEGSGPGEFRGPCCVCVDGGGNIFVTDRQNHRVQQFRHDGTFVRAFGSLGDGPAQFHFPDGICVGGDGSLFVIDQSRLQEFH
eukprot:gnl/Spiro4/13332_TR7091_c0_g1_i1.p1 gnl/Spiro4/13332_TR7091_c0_g1~~gnl/Spiro4/13332_TR7091_c0_g1_i1.p1  ORF type:complete len:336 (+),score=59.94 gnl/Spiro4/13332_TR7091_c0_g1_i1:145-1008(+)